MKSFVAPVKRIEKKTWVEKVTDDTNHWLQAKNLEKDGLLEEAVRHYLKDASEQKKRNIVRSALSMSCSARCLLRQGRIKNSSRLFLRAAELYESALSSRSSIEERNWMAERIAYCRRMASAALGGKDSAKKPSGGVS